MPDSYLSKSLPFKVGKYPIDFRIGVVNDAHDCKERNGNGCNLRTLHLGLVSDAGRVKEIKGGQAGFYCNAGKIIGGHAGFAVSAQEVEGFQGSFMLSGADEVKPIEADGILGKLLKLVGGVQISGIFNYAEYVDGIQIAPICYAAGGNFRQFGLITARGGDGRWYERITPLFGYNREK